MLAFLEYEEKVGWLWHRLVGDRASYPAHPEAAVHHAELRGALPVFFRGVGGEAGIEVVEGSPEGSRHRLRLRQRLGMEEERVEHARLTPERVLLPGRIELFPDRSLNRTLYFWQTAFLAFAKSCGPPGPPPADPLAADIARLQRAHRTTRAVLGAWPGLATRHADLSEAVRAVRPRRRLPPVEAAVEEVIGALLGGPPPAGEAALAMLRAVTGDEPAPASLRAPRNYRPFLPVPLWGEVSNEPSSGRRGQQGSTGTSSRAGEHDTRHRKARRRRFDQAARPDSLLLLNKGELMLLASDMVNVNRRQEEEEDAAAARRTADDLEELSLSEDGGSVAPMVRLDLDLAPAAADEEPVEAPLTYPEWHFRRGSYLPAHCSLEIERPPEHGELWQPDATARRRIRLVRRQFEALRPKRERVRRQLDGAELDTDALVRELIERAATGGGSDRVYTDVRDQVRDLAVVILVDQSLSTDAWVRNARVIDVEKEAVTVLGHGLDVLGDAFAIYGFTSRSRRRVLISEVKTFGEPFDEAARRRIASLRPGHYTRIGTAIRFAADRLALRPERHRLLLILTDGKPTDVDHYDGRHGIEDTRRAVHEARRAGAAVFAVTIDERAQTYVPYLFGRGGFAMIDHPERLPGVLPALYRQLTL